MDSVKKLLCAVPLIGCCMLCGTPKLQAYGLTASEFLQLMPSPQSVAMGEGILALYPSPSIMMVNPAATVRINQTKLSLNQSLLVEGISHQFLGFSMPVAIGSVGASLSYLSYGDIAGYDAAGFPYAMPQSYNVAATVNFSFRIKRNIPVLQEYGSIGLNFKFIHGRLADYAAEGMALDLGGIYKLPVLEGLSASAVFRNLGSTMKFVDQIDSLPSTFDLGLGYENRELGDLVLAANMGTENVDGASSFSVGGSFDPVDNLSVRAGWKEMQNNITSGLRFGLGMDFDNFSLSYTVVPFKEFNVTHHLGLDIALGSVGQSQAAYDYYIDHYFRLAKTKYYEKDYIAARQHLESILSIYPEHRPSKEYLGRINQALDIMDRKREVNISKWLRRAEASLGRRDFIMARRYYNYVLDLDPNNAAALDAQIKIGEMVDRVHKDMMAAQNRKKIMQLSEAAEDYYRQGEFVMAKEKFEEIVRLDNSNIWAKEYLIKIDKKLSEISSTQTNRLYVMGYDLYKQGKYLEAMKYFDAVVIAAPHRLDAKDYAESCRTKIVEEETKIREVEILRRQGEARSELESVYNRALKYYEGGNYDLALHSFSEARETAKRYEFKEYVEKVDTFMGLVKGALAERHYKIGFDFYQKNQFESAAAEYRRVLQYEPNHTSARIELQTISATLSQQYYEQGMNAFTMGDTVKAEGLFMKAKNYDPGKVEVIRALERLKAMKQGGSR